MSHIGDVQAEIDNVAHDHTPLLELYECCLELYEQQGEGEAPYPPQFPKMEGEPLRVQPSRARKPVEPEQ